MTLQLHVKVPSRYTDLKFQLGLANPRFVISTRDENSKFSIIKIFSFFFFFFLDASDLAFLLSLNFLFTRDYYISIWVKIFSFSYNHISYNCIFFQFGIPSWNFNPRWKSPYNQPLDRNWQPFNSLFSSLHHSFSRKTLDTIVELLFLSKLTCRIINSYLR